MRIAQVLTSSAWGDVTPEALTTGIGGREGTLLRLSREWARSGHEVDNYVNLSLPTEHDERVDGGPEDDDTVGVHRYMDVGMAADVLANRRYDAVVAWECPEVFRPKRIQEVQRVRVAEYQVAHTEYGAPLDACSAIFTLSPWHSEFVLHDNPGLDARKLHAIPNGVDLMTYPEGPKRWQPGMADPRFFYSSSPDRGLVHLLRMWPMIRDIYPEATLAVAYGATNWTSRERWSHFRQGQVALDIEEGLQQEGVRDVGVVGARELAQIQMLADVWAYPCDTIQPTETGCITAVEAGAAGCPMVITDCDCLPSEFEGCAVVVPLPFHDETFVQAIHDVLSSPGSYDRLRAAGRQLAEERSWERLSRLWTDKFEALAS